MENGFVYFIKMEETREIKIGFTVKNPKERLKDLQTGNSNKLILLGYIDGTKQDEYNLHQEFSEERKSIGEWFKPSPRLKFRINELLEKFIEDKKSGIEDLNQGNDDDLEYKGGYKEGKYHGRGEQFRINLNSKWVIPFWALTDEERKSWKPPKPEIIINYKGTFENGKRHGNGELNYVNDGSRYKGEFKDGKPNGQGKYYKKGKIYYKGEFKDGKPNGQGKFFKRRFKFDGEWVSKK